MTRETQESWTDDQLVQGLRAGNDARCLEELVRRYRPALLRFCTAYLRDAARAEDVVQETIGTLVVGAALPEDALKPWLYRIARNRCLDILRRQQRSPTHNRRQRTGFDAPAPTAGPGTRLAREERRVLIRQIVEEMPEEYRAVLMLKYFEGFARSEIAQTLDVSEATVKGRIVRASEYLERQLRELTWAQP